MPRIERGRERWAFDERFLGSSDFVHEAFERHRLDASGRTTMSTADETLTEICKETLMNHGLSLAVRAVGARCYSRARKSAPRPSVNMACRSPQSDAISACPFIASHALLPAATLSAELGLACFACLLRPQLETRQTRRYVAHPVRRRR